MERLAEARGVQFKASVPSIAMDCAVLFFLLLSSFLSFFSATLSAALHRSLVARQTLQL
jgi:hypothetical protein